MELTISWIGTLADAVGLKPWALTVFSVILLALLIDFVQRHVMKKFSRVVADSRNLWDDALFDAGRRPLSVIIWLTGITLAAQFIPGSVDDGLFDARIIVTLRQVGIIIALTWFLVSLVKHIESNLIESARREGRDIDQTTVNALGRIVRITIVVTATLITLETMGFSISGLLAAGGIGGLAVGLAAKDLLANFFGGVTVFIDRPFSVGDWILLKDKGTEGVVEKIGWRQTTIRKFDKRPVYVPNAIFTTASVENPSRMTHRRIYETIGIRYDDITLMDTITEEVRNMLLAHPEIDTDQTLMVQFNAFGPSSLDFFIYCMTHTVNWQKYHEVKQDVLLKIGAIVAANGASIAYPTQTLKIDRPPEFAGLELNEPEAEEPAE
jgi:MscS family membrane protein